MHEEIIKKYYRKKADGSLSFIELSSYNFRDQDAFLEACYMWEADGYYDDRQAALDVD